MNAETQARPRRRRTRICRQAHRRCGRHAGLHHRRLVACEWHAVAGAAAAAVRPQRLPQSAGSHARRVRHAGSGRWTETSRDRLAHGRRLQHARGFLDRRCAGQRPVGERVPQGRARDDVPHAARRNTDTGGKEFFYGEVDDVLAAADHLATLPYVDAQYIYLGGHSTGGTLALLTAEASTRFKAVFAFGAVSRMNRYPASLVPDSILENSSENRLRSPIHWLDGISTPTVAHRRCGSARATMKSSTTCAAHTRNAAVHCISVPGFDHFSVLGQVSRVIAARLVGGQFGNRVFAAPAGFPASRRQLGRARALRLETLPGHAAAGRA